MEIIGKTDKRWVETISSKDTIKTELYNFEIDVEEMESGTAFQFQTSVVANEYYNPKATLVDIVISDPNWKETNLWWAQNWRPLHFTVFISGEKQKSKYVITEFYDLLLSYAAKIGKSGRSAWIGLEDLYSHFHRVFCSITWEILNRYSDIYAWDNFGELMFYTLFSPEIRKTKYK
ncbi:MAG TPA: hypothetical protein ENK91_09710, partial [Bacteroidetes bacterium]|nr:hypothetical protein [Bacteroidota bacterium]